MSVTSIPDQDRLLTPSEVGALWHVSATTVRRWAKAGKLTAIPTPGGRLFRYRQSEVRALMAAGVQERAS